MDNNINIINSYITAINEKNVNEIKILTNNNNNNNNLDIVLEIYKSNLLTSEGLQFIMEKCSSYLNISNTLLKSLLKDNNLPLVDIVFENLKFYDIDIIKNFLVHYKNRIPISTEVLKRNISRKRRYSSMLC